MLQRRWINKFIRLHINKSEGSDGSLHSSVLTTWFSNFSDSTNETVITVVLAPSSADMANSTFFILVNTIQVDLVIY